MRRLHKFILVLLIISTPTLQLAATESANEQFKQELLAEIQEEIKDLHPAEIREIIDTVDKQLSAYISHYEDKPEDELRTKGELYLEAHKDDITLAPFARNNQQVDKSREQLILEAAHPKLKNLSKDEYRFNEETKEFELLISKDELFDKGEDSMLQGHNAALPFLEKGDVLINLDNGSSAGLFKWGHAAIMYHKNPNPKYSRTIEAPGPKQVVQLKNYQDVWHANTWSRIAYNYVPHIYGTKRPAQAAEKAYSYRGTPYGLGLVLGDTKTLYCTELVFLAYLSQGVNLGNGMKKGTWGILMPKQMYCDPKLKPYYLQRFNGRVC